MASQDSIVGMENTVEEIIKTGDLSRMHDVYELFNLLEQGCSNCESVSPVRWTLMVLRALDSLISQMDAGSLQILSNESQIFELFIDNVIRKEGTFFEATSNPIFRELLYGALKQQLGQHHEFYVRPKFTEAMISCKVCSGQLEEIDRLWMKTCKGANNYQDVVGLYSDHRIRDVLPLKLAIRLGISRHIRMFSGEHFERLNFNDLDVYTKSRLIEWMVASNVAAETISPVKQLRDCAHLVNEWINEQKFFSSQIYQQDKDMSISDQEITKKVVPRILRRVDICAAIHVPSTQESVEWLVREMCREMDHVSPTGTKWDAILTGSAAEGTKTFFFDEYDFI